MNPNDPVRNPANPVPSAPAPVPVQDISPPQTVQPQVTTPVTPDLAQQPNSQIPATPTQYPNTGPAPKNNKKLLYIALPIAVVLLILGIVAALALGGKKESSKVSSPVATKPSPQPAAGIDTKAASTAALVKTPLDKKIVTDFGYSITLNEMVTGYVPRHPDPAVAPLLLKVTIAQASPPKYSGTSPETPNFVLIVDGQEVTQAQYYTGSSNSNLTQDGYPQLMVQPATAGAPNIGYIQFGVPKGKKPTALRYKQDAVKVLNSSKSTTIPAKDYDIVL